MKECERKVNAACSFLPSAQPTNDNSPWEMSVARSLHRDIMRGTGFRQFSRQHEKSLEAAMVNSALGSETTVTNGIPALDFIGDTGQRYLDILFEEVLASDRVAYRRYLSNLLRGVGAITAVRDVLL